MVMLDKLRIRNVFVRNGVTTEESAEEIAEVLDEGFTAASASFVTSDQQATSQERLFGAIAGMERRFAEFIAQQAERDARQAERDARQAERVAQAAHGQAERDRRMRNCILVAAGLIIAAIGIRTGVLIAFLA